MVINPPDIPGVTMVILCLSLLGIQIMLTFISLISRWNSSVSVIPKVKRRIKFDTLLFIIMVIVYVLVCSLIFKFLILEKMIFLP